jgi:hypothetical protein
LYKDKEYHPIINWLGDVGRAGVDILDNLTGKTQFDLQERSYQDQLKENRITRQREDTAVTRRYADLKKAGINPLLAAGGQAAMSAPQKVGQSPNFESYIGKMIQYQTLERIKQQLANDKTMQKQMLASIDESRQRTSLIRQQESNETAKTLLNLKDYDTYNERLWHSRINLGTRVGSEILKGVGGGLFLKNQKKLTKTGEFIRKDKGNTYKEFYYSK